MTRYQVGISRTLFRLTRQAFCSHPAHAERLVVDPYLRQHGRLEEVLFRTTLFRHCTRCGKCR